VIAPINVTRGGYPQEKDLASASGLSIGNMRWDVRQAVVVRQPQERGQGTTW
jgi:hypothetical protein